MRDWGQGRSERGVGVKGSSMSGRNGEYYVPYEGMTGIKRH